jgi:hypothetical protein
MIKIFKYIFDKLFHNDLDDDDNFAFYDDIDPATGFPLDSDM